MQTFMLRRPGGGSVVGRLGLDMLRSLASPISEVVIGFQWLYSVLSSDATLTVLAPGGIHRSLAPPGTATPFVMMAYQSGLDTVTMNAYRVLSDLLYQVKAVGPATISSSIFAAASRIDALIGKPPGAGVTSGGLVASCSRQQELLIDEPIAGEIWSNAGGLYSLLIEQSQ